MTSMPDYFVPCEYEYIIKNEVPQAKSLSQFIATEFKPKTVIDIGCGPGLYVTELLKHNIKATGIDIDPRVNDMENLHQCDFATKDFNKQFPDRFDLAICLEVVEHIPEKFAKMIIQNICHSADRIIFSAAKPGQQDNTGGHHNEQHKPYWLSLFNDEGYYRDAGASFRMLKHIRSVIHMKWFANNAMVVSTLAMNTYPFDL